MMSVWSLQLVLIQNKCAPTERRKATEQNVRDHTSCPNVNLEAISMKSRHHVLDYMRSRKNTTTLKTGTV